MKHPRHPHWQSRPSFRAALPGWEESDSRGPRPLIGVLRGEGIGPEIMDATVDVLQAVAERYGHDWELRYGGAIGMVAEKTTGQALTAEVIDFCAQIFAEGGAILCGPGGGRFVYDLRAEFDLYCKLIPVRPMPVLNDAGVLRPAARDAVDLVVVRENTAGGYFGAWSRGPAADGDDEARHAFSYRASQVRRILAVAIRLAQQRRGRLTLAVKPGGIPTVSALWTDHFQDMVQGEDIEARVLEVDNATYQLIASAQAFDVLVAPNLFGDILGDAAALLLGSRGLSFSGNFGAPGMAVYQTGHGAARDLAGQGVANPIAQIWSAAMMLRESFGMFQAADVIETAVVETLARGIRTADLAGPQSQVVGTREMGETIADTVLTQSMRVAS